MTTVQDAIPAQLPSHATTPDEQAAIRARLLELRAAGHLDLPLPTSGRLAERWAALWELGAGDLLTGRFAEAHTDAVAILAEAGHPPVDGLLGVWASRSEQTGLTATAQPDGSWTLDGTLRYCSGARLLDAALVTAQADDGYRLFVLRLDTDATLPLVGTWQAVGMAATDSLDVRVEGYRAPAQDAVGEPGWYLRRPGFWIGGVGVAAVWAGGADGVVRAFASGLHRSPRDPDPHALAHLGGCVADVRTMRAVLDGAAREVLADPGGDHRTRAVTVRSIVEQAASDVLTRAGRATGATPLCRDGAYARRVSDLTTYLRQSHAERDLESIGRARLEAVQPDDQGSAP